MLSYSVYKVVHLISLMFFFTAAAIQLQGSYKGKLFKIITGIATLLILISGMGLIARLGMPHGEPWPMWINVKMGIWLGLAITIPVIVKRFTSLKGIFYWISMVLFASAAYIAVYKPFV
ncbi:MAG: SirB2 family protein [Bdellovibrionales bacterium]